MANVKILQFEPSSELLFKAPFTEPSPSGLKLTNPGDRVVVFKVKTTAPKKYSVRPTHGVVLPHSTATIQVILIPSDVESLLVAQRRHKFMVQAAFGPDNANANFDAETFWRYFNNSGNNRSSEQRFRCVFDFQFGSQTVPAVQLPAAIQAGQIEQSNDQSNRMSTPMASTISSNQFMSTIQDTSMSNKTGMTTGIALGSSASVPITTPMSNSQSVQQRPSIVAAAGLIRPVNSPLDATSSPGASSRRTEISTGSASTAITQNTGSTSSATWRKVLLVLCNILLVVALMVGLYLGRGSIYQLNFRY